jgi:hypothetical protein
MTMPYQTVSSTSNIRTVDKHTLSVNDLRNEPGATGLINNYKDHTDPKYIGPGTWNVIHRRAFSARTRDQQLQFIDLMNEICHGFPCTVCKDHCSEYIKTHPMEEYLGVTIDIDGVQTPIGIFIWTWKFHNAVNARIKKPIMTWDTAYNLYSEKESLVCSKNCLEAENFPPDGSENSAEYSIGFTKPLIPYQPKTSTTDILTSSPSGDILSSPSLNQINQINQTIQRSSTSVPSSSNLTASISYKLPQL